jgi:hypothetical protein
MWVAAVAALAVYVAAVASAYVFGLAGVERHHVESPSIILGVLLGVVAVQSIRGSSAALTVPTAHARWPDVLVVATGAALFSRTATIGLLSDDFTLWSWAANLMLLPEGWPFVRPVPLAAWAAISRLVPDTVAPLALHTLNILLHVANGLLTLKLARVLGLEPWRAACAGVFFVACPLTVEAVAWAAGIFDLLMVTFTLLFLIVLLHPTKHHRRWPSLFTLAALALLTKETAVALPAIGALCIFAANAPPRLYRVTFIVAALAGAYALWRALSGTEPPPVPLTGYAAKEMVTRPFAALALPFHESLLARRTLLPLTGTLLIPLLLAYAPWTWRERPAAARRFVPLGLWVSAGVAPLMTMMFVGADLQGSRYLYLPSVGWALLLADVVPEWSTRWRTGPFIAGALLVAYVAATTAHVEHWVHAARVRDDALQAAAEAIASCRGEARISVPDHHRGAYVLRNGAIEALHRSGADTSRCDVVIERR